MVLDPINPPAALTKRATSSSATNINSLKRIALGAIMLSVDTVMPIKRMAVFGLALCKIMVAAIRKAAVMNRD